MPPSRLAAFAAALVLIVPVAQAAPIGLPTDPDPTWVTNGAIAAMARSGHALYLGGSFTRIAPYTGGGVAVAAADGGRRPFPAFDGEVDAVAADGTGGWYVGGRFSHADALARTGLAHVLADGSVDPAFVAPAISGVLALAVHPTKLFVGGRFSPCPGTDGEKEVVVVAVHLGPLVLLPRILQGERMEVELHFQRFPVVVRGW